MTVLFLVGIHTRTRKQVTIAVPPALPAAMTIGIEFAIERLKQVCVPPPSHARA